ncbi:MAG: hypothetical protein A2Y76_15330 [Planctomycetes bacterium RBG_13_60_9]|nr:MAG: hypothetical protein A2Y76_15330 [Planctomycetes bacterium RBG_13_60_9]
MPVGTRVVFALSPETEGVWMPGAHGMIATRLTLQWYRAADCAECDAGAGADVNEAALPDSAGARTETDVSRPVPASRWLTLATDGARDIRMGPSIGGRGQVAVPVRFVKTGVFCLRGIINTSVRSWSPAAAGGGRDRAAKDERSDTTVWPDNLLARDVDVVYVAVRVVEKSDVGRDAENQDDPDATHTREIPRITEVEVIDLEDDGLGDLGVLAGQQEGGDFLLPIENEDIGN